jgi:hypothetical protein
VINAQLHGVAATERVAPPIRRISPGAFWMLFVIEGVVIAAVLFLTINLVLPARVPLARSGDIQLVRDAIWDRLNGSADDPIVQLPSGANVRESNLRGFALNGQTYYYYVEGRRGFDPLSRGEVRRDGIEVLLHEQNGPESLVIYRLLGT